MQLTMHDGAVWDFVDAEGEAIPRAETFEKKAAEFPTRWRVFGPLAAQTTSREPWSCCGQRATALASAEIDRLRKVPETLTVGDSVLTGRDVVMAGDVIDLGALYGGYEEGQQAYDPTYAIYVVVQNERPAAARTGDVVGVTTVYGTNGYRDLIRNALHDQDPAQSANGFYSDRSEFRGVQVVYQDADVFVMRAGLVVRETPAAV